jgi:hypothetical protein
LPIFAVAAALLVGRRSIKDILPPRALQHRQTNAPIPHFVIGSKPSKGSVQAPTSKLQRNSKHQNSKTSLVAIGI